MGLVALYHPALFTECSQCVCRGSERTSNDPYLDILQVSQTTLEKNIYDSDDFHISLFHIPIDEDFDLNFIRHHGVCGTENL